PAAIGVEIAAAIDRNHAVEAAAGHDAGPFVAADATAVDTHNAPCPPPRRRVIVAVMVIAELAFAVTHPLAMPVVAHRLLAVIPVILHVGRGLAVVLPIRVPLLHVAARRLTIARLAMPALLLHVL